MQRFPNRLAGAALLAGTLSIFVAAEAVAAPRGQVGAGEIQLRPAKPMPGKVAKIAAAVTTAGSGRLDVAWQLELDGKRLASGVQRRHPAGRAFQATAAWNATPGRHTLTLLIDPRNALGESTTDRSDNTRNLRFAVAEGPPEAATQPAPPPRVMAGTRSDALTRTAPPPRVMPGTRVGTGSDEDVEDETPAEEVEDDTPEPDWDAWGAAATSAAIDAINQWRLQAELRNIDITGPTANCADDCLSGPDFTASMNAAMLTDDVPADVAEAFSQGLWEAWDEWQRGVTVPGLPWYPAFTAFPGPQAPPTPNIPSPLVALVSKSGSLLTPTLLATKIRLYVPDVSNQPGANAAINTFAADFTGRHGLWIAGNTVINVIGSGPVPSFAPPVVPVGPVIGGKAHGPPGVLSGGMAFPFE